MGVLSETMCVRQADARLHTGNWLRRNLNKTCAALVRLLQMMNKQSLCGSHRRWSSSRPVCVRERQRCRIRTLITCGMRLMWWVTDINIHLKQKQSCLLFFANRLRAHTKQDGESFGLLRFPLHLYLARASTYIDDEYRKIHSGMGYRRILTGHWRMRKRFLRTFSSSSFRWAPIRSHVRSW